MKSSVYCSPTLELLDLSPATMHPDEEWVVAQAESFVRQARSHGLPVSLPQHDRDTKFTKYFEATLKRHRVQTKRGAYRAPNTNAFVERFIQSIEQECFDRFVVFGEKHLDHLCSEYLAHYHEERPHQSLDNVPVKEPRKPDAREQSLAISKTRLFHSQMCVVGNDWEACSRATVAKRREIVIPSLIPRRAARLLRNAQEVFALLAQSQNTHPLY